MRTHLKSLFVVRDNRFEQIAKPLITLDLILPGDLKKELFERVQAAQGVAGDCVGQARAQHNELMLAVALSGTAGPAHGIVKPAELALGAGIHIAQAIYDGMCLVVQIQAVANQLFELDIGSHVGTPVSISRATSAGTPAFAP